MWLAHALTLLRIPLALALGWTWGWGAVALVALAALTDLADGNVARWMQRRGHTRPAIGGWLDPLVDKLFVAIVIVAIWRHTDAHVALVLVATREVLLAPLFVVYLARGHHARPLRADPIGKTATVAQFVALALIVADVGAALAVAGVAAALGVASVVHYVRAELNAGGGGAADRSTSPARNP
jgi:phosphatidylglycerophosphate synthase